MTAFRVALYDEAGALVKNYVGRPIWDQATAQQTADMVARSADTGCNHPAGLVAVWNDPGTQPAERPGVGPKPDAIRIFRDEHPEVPAYRWVYGDDWKTVLIPA